jgi:hypothetical protein
MAGRFTSGEFTSVAAAGCRARSCGKPQVNLSDGFCYNACGGMMVSGSVQLRPVKLNLYRGLAAALLPFLAIVVAGCEINTKIPAAPAVDPNLYPQNYRKQIAIYLSQQLLDRADFRGTRISQPVLKPVGDTQHYIVCVQFSGHSEMKSKVAIYLAGQITQFVDSTPEQCGDAAYAPFTELEQTLPDK